MFLVIALCQLQRYNPQVERVNYLLFLSPSVDVVNISCGFFVARRSTRKLASEQNISSELSMLDLFSCGEKDDDFNRFNWGSLNHSPSRRETNEEGLHMRWHVLLKYFQQSNNVAHDLQSFAAYTFRSRATTAFNWFVYRNIFMSLVFTTADHSESARLV